MNRRTLAAYLVGLIAIGLAAGACNGGLTFTFTEKSQKQTIDGGGSLTDTPLTDRISPFDFQFNLEQKLEKRDAGPAQEVNLESLDLKVTNTNEFGSGEPNFNFLSSITFYADAEGLDKKRIAWKDDVPDGKQRLSLNVDDSVDLKPYIEQGMTLSTEASGERPDNDTQVQGIIKLRVRAL